MNIQQLLLVALICTQGGSVFAQSYSIDWSTIKGGAGTSTGGNYSLDSTTSEPDAASALSGATYSLHAGFQAITAIQTPDAPRLSVQSTTTNTIVVSWPASSESFALQQTSNLNAPNWALSPQAVNTFGGFKFIVVNPSGGNLYYRLTKPVSSSAFQVTNLNDSGPGSLRATVQSATNNATVTFAPGLEGLIVLNSELAINKNLSITGPGATVVAVGGNNTNRIFNVSNGSVAISGLTIRDGWVRGDGNGGLGRGGGVFNSANLVLSNCAVVANLAVGADGNAGNNTIGGAGGGGLGGGIYSTGTLALVNCTLALNVARGGNGGRGADSAGNFGFPGGAGGGGLGGAVCNDGLLTITNCTFVANQVMGGNGGNGGEGGLSIGSGGAGGAAEGAGVLNRQSCQLANVTFAGGAAQRGVGGTGGVTGTMGVARGSGVRTTTATASLVNTLIAQNTLGAGGQAANGPDVFGTFASHGYNLIGVTNGSSGWIASDKRGNDVTPLDPLIEAVQNNSGWTPTMALSPGSPAIDQGKAIGLATDQRGLPRPFDEPAVINAAGGNGSDIGAFESGY